MNNEKYPLIHMLFREKIINCKSTLPCLISYNYGFGKTCMHIAIATWFKVTHN